MKVCKYIFLIIFVAGITNSISCGENNLSIIDDIIKNESQILTISSSEETPVEITVPAEQIYFSSKVIPEIINTHKISALELNIEEEKEIFYDKNSGISGFIIRKNTPIVDKDGTICVEMYFDKPVLNGETEAIAKINALFYEEEKGYFYGSENFLNFLGEGQKYYDIVEYAKEFPSSTFKEGSFIYTVDTDIMYIGNNIMSVKEYANWQMIGVNCRYIYGITVDTNTGDLITVDYFVNESINDFNEKVLTQLVDELYPLEDLKKYYTYYRDKQIEDLKSTIQNYSFADYEYFYDGESINLIFNGILDRSSYVMQIESEY